MKRITQATPRRGAVLIAVVGILAVLSLMAAVFGMLMSMERAAGRNMREHELARQAAHAGYEHIIRTLRESGIPDKPICPNPDSPFYSQEVFRGNGVKVGFITAEPVETASEKIHVALKGKDWATGTGYLNAGLFDLNAMGVLADYGNDTPHKGTRYTSFEVSLTNLIKARLDKLALAEAPDAGADDLSDFYTNSLDDPPAGDTVRRNLARMIATAIIAYRYGDDGVPGRLSFDNSRYPHAPDWALTSPTNWATSDSGVGTSGQFWGAADGPASSTTLIAVNQADALTNWWRATGWEDNTWLLPLHEVYFATGDNKGYWRTIITNQNGDELTVAALGSAPKTGDRFCINLASGLHLGQNDDAPAALLWPDGTLACEGDMLPLIVRDSNNERVEGFLSHVDSGNSRIMHVTKTFSLTSEPVVMRLLDGVGRGQVRRVTDVDAGAGTITLAEPWDTAPKPTQIMEKGVVSTAITTGGNTLTDSGKLWNNNALEGMWVEIGSDFFEIASNTGNMLTLAGSETFTADYPVTTTYTIYAQNYRIEYDCMEFGSVSSIPTNKQLQDSSATWTNDYFRGCIVNIISDSTSPDAVGQSRLITGNTGNTLNLIRPWRTTPSTSATYRILIPQDYKYRPDLPQGDDRVYHSVADILPVMVNALTDDLGNVDDAGLCAGFVYEAIRGSLTVSSQNVANTRKLCSVNDPATDGVDNDENGVVDDEDTTDQAQYLYEGLGLRAWVKAGADPATRVRQALQLVANIIDFRDNDNVPTTFVGSTVDNAYGGADTYIGYEGVHITEVMATPGKITSTTGDEISLDGGVPLVPPATDPNGGDSDNDGDIMDIGEPPVYPAPPAGWLPYAQGQHADLDGWDYNRADNYWEVVDPNPATGEWQWSLTAPAQIPDGWYSIRLRGGAGHVLTFSAYDADSGGSWTTDVDVTTNRAEAEGATIEYWDFVRDGSNKLVAVHVSAGVLQFRITAAQGMQFYGFQLLPQYVEITNCAAHDVRLDRITVNGATILFPLLPSNKMAILNGANADGAFPVRYGTYVVAMGEEAYARQWSGDSTNRYWGDQAGERYPVLFGDSPTPYEGTGGIVTSGNTLVTPPNTNIFSDPTKSWTANEHQGRLVSLSGAWYHITGNTENAITFSPPCAALASGWAYSIKEDYAEKLMVPLDTASISVYSQGEVIASTGATSLDGDIVSGGPCLAYISREKSGTPWSTTWADIVAAPVTALQGSQNREVQNQEGDAAYRSCLNEQYTLIWDTTAVPPPIRFRTAADFITARRAFPVILNRAFPSAGWLGLVPTGNEEWRTVDYDPSPNSAADGTNTRLASITKSEHLLGTLVANSTPGGVYGRINLNHTDGNDPYDPDTSVGADKDELEEMLNTVFSGTVATNIAQTQRPASGWDNWDQIIRNPYLQGLVNDGNENSGAGAIADDFLNDTDEEEEWVRRYGNLFTLGSTDVKYVIAGVVYPEHAKPGDAPVAVVRIEVDLEVQDSKVIVKSFRYATD